MKIFKLLMPLGLSALLFSACHHRHGDESACTGRTIKKQPLSRVEEGSAIVYTYEYRGQGAGCSDYQLVVVPAEPSKAATVDLLKKSGVITDAASVATLAERVAADTGAPEFKEPRTARMTEDLKKYSAIVERYVGAK